MFLNSCFGNICLISKLKYSYIKACLKHLIINHINLEINFKLILSLTDSSLDIRCINLSDLLLT